VKSLRQTEIIAIIPAAGLGRRFGPGGDKPFQLLGGKPLIIWPLEALQAMPEISEIIPVLRPEDAESAQKTFEHFGITKIRGIVPGGKERQDSVYYGLRFVENKRSIVLVHDGARPLAGRAFIQGMIAEMAQCRGSFDGIVPGIPVKATIKEGKDSFVRKTLKRHNLWAIQTPQIFEFEKLWKAYEQAMEEKHYATDDAAVLERYGGRIRIVTGSYRNIKITTPEDLVIAEALLKM
jgi:2-C-methyl-D-erythritol 4-phosphate cytidylyltransferase